MISVKPSLLKSCRRGCCTLLVLIWGCAVSPVKAEGVPPEVEAIMQRRSEAIGKIHTEWDKRTADLYDKYAAALEREVQNYRQGGDLQNLLMVTKEQKEARESRKTSDATAPTLEPYRKTLKDSLSKFEIAGSAAVAAVDAEAVKGLTVLRTQLTQAGSVDAAIAVDQKIKAIQGEQEGGAVAAAPAVRGTIVPKGQVAGGELFKSSEPWVGEWVLEPKRYLLRERMVLGREGKKNENQERFPATVYCPPGCRIDKGEVLVDEGLMQAEGTVFKEAVLQVDLGGTFEAQGSLFENCSMGKGGAWFVSHFSSKWIFDNCVFSGTFIRQWQVVSVGVKATNCTFYGVDFSPISYVEDAGEEVTHDWMTITGCRFVNCKIPESVLVATRDCVFEDCEFLGPDANLPVKTPIKTRIYVNQRKSLPVLGQNREVIILDVTPAQKNIGASVAHRRMGKSLNF